MSRIELDIIDRVQICLGVHSFGSGFLLIGLFLRFIFWLVLLFSPDIDKAAEEGNSLSAWSVSLVLELAEDYEDCCSQAKLTPLV